MDNDDDSRRQEDYFGINTIESDFQQVSRKDQLKRIILYGGVIGAILVAVGVGLYEYYTGVPIFKPKSGVYSYGVGPYEAAYDPEAEMGVYQSQVNMY